VPIAQSQNFYAALQTAGVPSQFVAVPGVGHSWIGKTAEATQTASRQSLARAVDFFEATIGDRPKQH
jgi:dipeptidyl aminopeptidase/acylaminoacyl peptidase